jgi:hypothetical protein
MFRLSCGKNLHKYLKSDWHFFISPILEKSSIISIKSADFPAQRRVEK